MYSYCSTMIPYCISSCLFTFYLLFVVSIQIQIPYRKFQYNHYVHIFLGVIKYHKDELDVFSGVSNLDFFFRKVYCGSLYCKIHPLIVSLCLYIRWLLGNTIYCYLKQTGVGGRFFIRVMTGKSFSSLEFLIYLCYFDLKS